MIVTRKLLKGYPKYVITNEGVIYNNKTKKFRKPYIHKKTGYMYLTLRKNGISKTLAVHRLVAINFIPNPETKPCVNHKDGVKTNNNIDNLEWCTHSENIIHGIKNGLNYNPPNWAKGKYGYDHNRSKEVHQYCAKTKKYIKSFGSLSEASREMGGVVSKYHQAVKYYHKTRDGYYYSYEKTPHFQIN